MCFMYRLNTNITMQHGELVPQRKSNSSLEVVNFLWINASGCNFNIMNTLYELVVKSAQCWKKLAVSFK